MEAPAPQDQALPAPPLWRHLLAMLYDTLLIVPLFMAAAAVWVAVLGPTDNINEPAVPAFLQWFSWGVILLIFFGIFWRRAGQTLGMQAWRLKLITESGGSPTWQQVAVRLVVATLSFGALGMGYFWRYLPPHRGYWHDQLSKTRLVLLPKAS